MPNHLHIMMKGRNASKQHKNLHPSNVNLQTGVIPQNCCFESLGCLYSNRMLEKSVHSVAILFN